MPTFTTRGSAAKLLPMLSPAWIFMATAATAQSVATPVSDVATASSDRLDAITVTAEKRTEQLQDVAIATTVITQGDIERAGINTIQDAAALTPNLVIIDQLRPGIQTVSFRGFTTVQGGQSPFAIVVDGVEQPGQEFLKQQLVDVQQIEILRGPQGTLYGAGAIAGAINIVTQPPTNEFAAAAKVGVSNGDGRNGTLTLSGPLIDDVLFYRVSAYDQYFNGLIDNEAGGDPVDFSHERSFNGEILYRPDAQLSVDFRAHDTNGKNGALWLVKVDDAQFDDFGINPDENTPGIDYRDLQTYSLKVDYALTPFTLTSISAYNKAHQYATADGDFSPASLFAQTWRNDTSAYSEELRVTSNDTGALKWNIGAFYQNYTVHDATTFFSIVPDEPFDAVTDNHYTDHSVALFGQASYDLTSQLTATLGLRYDRVVAGLDDAVNEQLESHVFSQPQPKGTLSYKFASTLMGYVTFAEGFRTGGFNPASPFAVRLYQNEVSRNYEAGLKSSFCDDRLVVNGALFHTDFKNQQFFFSEATDQGIYRVITNIPKTTVDGGEIEVQARITRDFQISGSAGYNKTEIKQFSDAAYEGNRTPQVYGLTSAVAFEYFYRPTSQLLATSRLDVDHRGDVYWDLANRLRTPPKTFVNLRVSLSPQTEKRWEVALYGHNLTNERTPSAVGADAEGSGVSLRSANEPRIYGAELTVRY